MGDIKDGEKDENIEKNVENITKNNAEEDSELLNNHINKLKEEIKSNENELDNNNNKLEDVLKQQESKNKDIKLISENISKTCLDKILDKYKPLVEDLESE